MKNHNGFTIIDTIFLILMLGCLTVIAIPPIRHRIHQQPPNITWGVNGRTEVRCVDGYKFIVTSGGGITQVIGDSGIVIHCSE